MTKQEIILCDIDGTVADLSHRKHFIDDEIRVGDTVYLKGANDSKDKPGKVIGQATSPYHDWAVDFRGAYPNHDVNYMDNHLRKAKSWNKFFEACKDDSPIQTTIDIIKVLSHSYSIAYCSGRPDTTRLDTQAWLLDKHLLCRWSWPIGRHHDISPLFMRPAGDTREDFIVKKELYLKHIEPFYKVKAVFDDRDQVVNMWRSLGLTCYQVAEGNF